MRSLPGAIFVISFVLYPYVYLAARAMFQTQSAALIEVARTLGATRFMLARHVALPLARPALAVGLSLALLETLNDIGASEYLGVQTLTLSIFTTWLNRSSLPGAAQIACVMLLVVIALMALERYGRRAPPLHHAGAARADRAAHPACRLVAPCRARALPRCRWLFGFLMPGRLSHPRGDRARAADRLRPDLITPHLHYGHAGRDRDRDLHRARASAPRWRCGWYAAGSLRRCLVIAGLGYAVPGTVLALGLLSPLVAIDEAINAVTRVIGGASASGSWSRARARP